MVGTLCAPQLNPLKKNIIKIFLQRKLSNIMYKRRERKYDEKSREHGSIIELSQSLNIMEAFILNVLQTVNAKYIGI